MTLFATNIVPAQVVNVGIPSLIKLSILENKSLNVFIFSSPSILHLGELMNLH